MQERDGRSLTVSSRPWAVSCYTTETGPSEFCYRSYSVTGNGNFPRISKAEIEDKRKGDAISKGLVIVQPGWFVTQCIARGAQGLPITQLELVTVAFAALNFVIFLLWWDKPLNLQRGVRVYKIRGTGGTVDDGDVEDTVEFWGALRDALPHLRAAIVRGPSSTDFKSWIFHVLTWPLVKPLYIMIQPDNGTQYERRVDTFYPAERATESKKLSTFIVVAIAVAFDGIPCIGWSFTSPSIIERAVWRLASLLRCPSGVSPTRHAWR